MAKENSGHKNLKPAKKGDIRNPKGKPVGTLNNTTILRNVLLASMTAEERKAAGPKFDPRIWLFEKLKTAAEDGKPGESVSATKEMFDRIEGKSVAKVEQTIKDDRSVDITFEEVTDASQIRPKDSED